MYLDMRGENRDAYTLVAAEDEGGQRGRSP